MMRKLMILSGLLFAAAPTPKDDYETLIKYHVSRYRLNQLNRKRNDIRNRMVLNDFKKLDERAYRDAIHRLMFDGVTVEEKRVGRTWYFKISNKSKDDLKNVLVRSVFVGGKEPHTIKRVLTSKECVDIPAGRFQVFRVKLDDDLTPGKVSMGFGCGFSRDGFAYDWSGEWSFIRDKAQDEKDF